MPTPVYSDVLTRESQLRLAALVRDLPHPVALAGGHAVRLRVQDAWRAAFRKDYFGSRDIDVVYFVDPRWSEREFAESAAGRAPGRIKALGFRPAGVFRFSQWLDNEGRVLEQALPAPLQLGTDYHELSIDPIVTHAHPASKKVLGYHPIDEPLFGRVFEGPELRAEVRELGSNVFLPIAHVLVATKLKSLPDRTKDDKAVKDLCDLYALAAYGGEALRPMRKGLHEILPEARQSVADALGHPLLPEAVRYLEVSEANFRAVIGALEAP